MNYILIMTLLNSNIAHIWSAEFLSKSLCENAGQEFLIQAHHPAITAKYICVEKGLPKNIKKTSLIYDVL